MVACDIYNNNLHYVLLYNSNCYFSNWWPLTIHRITFFFSILYVKAISVHILLLLLLYPANYYLLVLSKIFFFLKKWANILCLDVNGHTVAFSLPFHSRNAFMLFSVFIMTLFLYFMCRFPMMWSLMQEKRMKVQCWQQLEASASLSCCF